MGASVWWTFCDGSIFEGRARSAWRFWADAPYAVGPTGCSQCPEVNTSSSVALWRSCIGQRDNWIGLVYYIQAMLQLNRYWCWLDEGKRRKSEDDELTAPEQTRANNQRSGARVTTVAALLYSYTTMTVIIRARAQVGIGVGPEVRCAEVYAEQV